MLKKMTAAITAPLLLLALNLSAETQTLKVDRFQKIRVVGPANVDCIYCPDSVGYIVVAAPHPDQISWVEASTSGNKLKLHLRLPDDMRQGIQPIPANLPSVRVYTNYLTEVANEGDSIVRVITSTNVPAFTARLIGNGYLSIRGIDTENLTVKLLTGRGTMALHGTAQNENITLAGVGTIEADGIRATNATVKLAGTGNVGVWATDKLTIRGSGSGTIYFKGTPQISKKLTLGLKLQPLP